MSNQAASITALEVAQAFVDHVFCRFGVPSFILSDRGPQFRAAVWHQIWELLGTTVKHSTPHTPHSHGDVERQNRIINEMLRVMLHGQFPDILPRWNEYVKLIQFAMNNALVTRTGMTLCSSFSRASHLALAPELVGSPLLGICVSFPKQGSTAGS